MARPTCLRLRPLPILILLLLLIRAIPASTNPPCSFLSAPKPVPRRPRKSPPRQECKSRRRLLSLLLLLLLLRLDRARRARSPGIRPRPARRPSPSASTLTSPSARTSLMLSCTSFSLGCRRKLRSRAVFSAATLSSSCQRQRGGGSSSGTRTGRVRSFQTPAKQAGLQLVSTGYPWRREDRAGPLAHFPRRQHQQAACSSATSLLVARRPESSSPVSSARAIVRVHRLSRARSLATKLMPNFSHSPLQPA